jgi:AraC family transcriptional regulator
MTGVPHRLFLSALRLQAAKRLLLTSCASVTDVCFEVGYSSLGTFIRRLTKITGFSPIGIQPASRELAVGLKSDFPASDPDRSGSVVRGDIDVPADFRGPAFIGAFQTRAPISPLVACTVARAGGQFEILGVPDGHYYLIAAALPAVSKLIEYFICESALRAASRGVIVRGGLASGEVRLALSAPQPLDVPMVLALPILMAKQNAVFAGAATVPSRPLSLAITGITGNTDHR